MKNKIIWVDLDEVLAELLDYILEYNNYKIGEHTIDKNKIKDYHIHLLPELNVTKNEAIEWFRKPIHEDIFNFNIKPLNWSLKRLKELKKDWNKLIIVTARIEEIFWEYTKKWVENHFPDIFEEIIYTNQFSNMQRSKWEVCKELWVEFMIEDNYDYALNLAEYNIQTYVLEKPWNIGRKEKHKNIIRIKNWEEFMK